MEIIVEKKRIRKSDPLNVTLSPETGIKLEYLARVSGNTEEELAEIIISQAIDKGMVKLSEKDGFGLWGRGK